ncbi:NADH:flavin oxidoreductase [Candidatus Poribacteria bacterium]|nr:NADH:flavin oxidoreductase [Candidatus Poribacteria bacterium]
MNDILAQPIQIGHIQAKNRILMPPMYRPWSDDSGKVSDKHIAHYRERAEGGVGTIVVETTAVLREYRLSQNNIGIWSDEHIDGLSKIAEVIRKNSALAFIQINHTALNRALSLEEITTARNTFVDAAARAEKAGFQGVELHAAHGFLLSQLLSSTHNQQKDEYGGTINGRTRLLLEIIPLAREKTKPDFALGVRLGIDTLEEGREIARKLSLLVDYLSISHGAGGGETIQVPPDYPFSPTVYRAERVKPHVTVPVVAVGGIKTGEMARQILAKGIADLIAVGRGMLADAKWAEKALSYRDDEIQPYQN